MLSRHQSIKTVNKENTILQRTQFLTVCCLFVILLYQRHSFLSQKQLFQRELHYTYVLDSYLNSTILNKSWSDKFSCYSPTAHIFLHKPGKTLFIFQIQEMFFLLIYISVLKASGCMKKNFQSSNITQQQFTQIVILLYEIVHLNTKL